MGFGLRLATEGYWGTRIQGMELATEGYWGGWRSYSGALRGAYSVYNAMTAALRGVYAFTAPYTDETCGLYRIANDALRRYELYRGVDAAPDLSAAPWVTFAELPYQTPALTPGHTYYFLTRLRNAYDLISANIEVEEMEIDVSGDLVAASPSAPANITLVAWEAGSVRMEATYDYLADGDDAGTRWATWATDDGTDPDPDNDPATAVISMAKVDGTARLDWRSDPYADGATIKAIVRTRRVDAGPVNIDSSNTTISSVEADTDGPAAPSAGVFFPAIAEQAQES